MPGLDWTIPVLPLPAVAAAAEGDVAELLASRVAGRDDVRVHRNERWTVVLAETERLPWADGVVYLGELPGTTRVLVPVHSVPVAPPDVVRAALRKMTGGASATVALLPAAGGGDIVVLEA